MRALKAVRLYSFGVENLIVKLDAEYIKGMLKNPDIQPNATINRWIAPINVFPFDIEHVLADKHGGADGLSRRPQAPEDTVEDDDDDVEEWIDRVNGFGLWELWTRDVKEGVDVMAFEELDDEGEESEVEEDEQEVEGEGSGDGMVVPDCHGSVLLN